MLISKRKRYHIGNFFQELSGKCNYMDEDAVKEVYYGLISYIGSEIEKYGKLDCPDLGVFSIGKREARNAYNINTKKVEFLGKKKEIRFAPCLKMKAYFRKLK